MRSLFLAAALTLAAPRVHASPTLGVMIASSSDTSPGALDARVRSQHGEIVRRALRDVLRRSGADVRLTAGARQLDVAVVRWRVTPGAAQTDVAVELRIVVADAQGRMLSILTGRARISAPGRAPLAALREQAIAEAIHGMTAGLHAQLAREVG